MATAAAITSTPSPISNVANNKSASTSALLSLATKSIPSASSELNKDPVLARNTVSSSSSRSRRSRISHFYHSLVEPRASTSSTYIAGDSKSMNTSSSSHSHASKAPSILPGGGMLDTVSKSKTGSRKWKEDSGCKSKTFKWKSDVDHVTSGDFEIGETSSGRNTLWNCNNKNRSLSGNLYKMKGLKWKVFSEDIGKCDDELHSLSEEEDETVLRLDQSDMGLYGLCPETDAFYAVICDICSAVVKPQGLQKHMFHRHYGTHSNKHHNHRQMLAGHPSISSGSNSDRIISDQSSISIHSSNIPHATMQMTPSERQSEKSSNPGKSLVPEISTTLLTVPRSIGSIGSLSTSNSSKLKNKSTSKVKSKSGKSTKGGKSGNTSSNHSSAAPSPSSSSSSSGFSATSSRNGTVICSTPSNGAATSNSSISANSSTSIATSSTGSVTQATPMSSVSTRCGLGSQAQINEKQTRTVGHFPSVRSTTSNSSQIKATSPNNGNSPSKKSIISLKTIDGVDLNNSKCCGPYTSSLSATPNHTSIIPSATNSTSNTTSLNSRRTHNRYTSSSADRKNVPVKEREYDANKHCGVMSGESSRPCTRSLTCKAHSLSMRRMVSGRSKSFDKLLADHRASREIPQTTKSKTVPEIESSNSSSSMDLDRRSVSSNSNLSVEVQASSTSSQSSVTAAASAETPGNIIKQSTSPPSLTTSVLSNSSYPLAPTVRTSYNRDTMEIPSDDGDPLRINESTPYSIETVEVNNYNLNHPVQVSVDSNGRPQITAAGITESSPTAGNARHRITARVIETDPAGVPPELLDDSKFSTDIFSPESTVFSGPIRFVDEEMNRQGLMKRLKYDFDFSKMSEERKLQLMVQRKVKLKNRLTFRGRNRPGPTAITIPPVAEIVAQAFAQENPTATLTDAQVIIDPETDIVSVSVCGTFHPDQMELNWAPFNSEFMNNTLARALSPYGITLQATQQSEQGHTDTNLMPNPEDEGFQIHHLPPLTEEEYNQMRPEFINGMPKPSMIGFPGIKTEIKQEVVDPETEAALMSQPLLPSIKLGNIKEEIKVEIKEEPLEAEAEKSGTSSDTLNMSQTPPEDDFASDFTHISSLGDADSAADVSNFSDRVNDTWVTTKAAMHTESTLDPSYTTSTHERFSEDTTPEPLIEKNSENWEPMIMDTDDENDDSDMELLQPIAAYVARTAQDQSLAVNGKDNSNSESDDRCKKTPSRYCGTEGSEYRNSVGTSFYYGRLPKPNYVNTFGLLKLRGSTNFKKSLICTRRTNSSMHTYQTLFHGARGSFFRRDNANSLGSKHCTVDSNGAISLNGSNVFETNKIQNSCSPSGAGRNSCNQIINSFKSVKQPRRQNSVNSSSNPVFKRQLSNYVSPSTSTQTQLSSPFFRRYNASNSGGRVRLQKRSIIMHFRGNGSGQQHLSKTCAILQSQIVNKLAEQLLGFKRANYQKSNNVETNSSISSAGRMGATKQITQQIHHSSTSNCKLPQSKSPALTMTYHSTNSETSLPALQTGQLLPAASSMLTSMHHPHMCSGMKVPRVSITPASTTNINLAKCTNQGTTRFPNNIISQRYSSATPVAIVAPIVTQPSLAGTAGLMPSMQSNSSMCSSTRGRNAAIRASSSMLPSSTIPLTVVNSCTSRSNANNANGVNKL